MVKHKKDQTVIQFNGWPVKGIINSYRHNLYLFKDNK